MVFLIEMVSQSPLATMYFVHVNCYRSLLILHVCNNSRSWRSETRSSSSTDQSSYLFDGGHVL